MMKQLRYIRERAVNAAWMIRNGEFREIVRAIFVEIGHRMNDVRTWWLRIKPKKLVRVPHSAYEDLTRCIPPSPRPTHSRLVPPPDMRADPKRVFAGIENILAGIVIEEVGES